MGPCEKGCCYSVPVNYHPQKHQSGGVGLSDILQKLHNHIFLENFLILKNSMKQKFIYRLDLALCGHFQVLYCLSGYIKPFSFMFPTKKREEERGCWAPGRQFRKGCGFLRSGCWEGVGWLAMSHSVVWGGVPPRPGPPLNVCVCVQGAALECPTDGDIYCTLSVRE